jgi:hypothetical protein
MLFKIHVNGVVVHTTKDKAESEFVLSEFKLNGYKDSFCAEVVQGYAYDNYNVSTIPNDTPSEMNNWLRDIGY